MMGLKTIIWGLAAIGAIVFIDGLIVTGAWQLIRPKDL